MGGNRSRVRVWVWVLAFAAVVTDVLLTWRAFDTGEVGGSEVIWPLVLAVFTFSGAIIVSRQPGNAVGWLLMVPGITSPLSSALAIGLLSYPEAPAEVTPLIWFSLWFTSISWVLLIFPVFHLMLVFPTGRLLGPRWRWVASLEALMLTWFLFLVAFGESMEVFVDDEVVWTVANPIGFVPNQFWESVFNPVWGPLLALLALSCLAAIVQRFRKSRAVERQQMKWLLFAVGVFGVVYAVQAIFVDEGPTGIGDVLFIASLTMIPVAITIAVLRYHLFEIDRLLSRSVTYALVVGLLAAVFFGLITLLSTFLPDSSDLGIAASTLAVFALFNPLRRRIQGVVDRRFNRSRYDSQRVIDEFTTGLREQLDSDQVIHGWLGVVSSTMQPASVGIWLR